jgi:outer membrane scaffolding protein for murein synthesis (MipA/OmpV family)
MKKLLTVGACIAVALIAIAGNALAAGAGGVTGPSFYVDGTLYRTVGMPTDLSATGAPDESFDTIYQFFAAQAYNVATHS